jgi:hypothetical protein
MALTPQQVYKPFSTEIKLITYVTYATTPKFSHKLLMLIKKGIPVLIGITIGRFISRSSIG